MDIAAVDYWASCHRSYLHRSSTSAKLLTTALLLAAVLATSDLVVLLALYLSVAAAIVATRLPAGPILALAAYPALFGLLFAVARWDGSLGTPSVILLKTLASALTVVALIATTPSPQLFAALGRFLPSPVSEALFLTYRSIFILLGLLARLLTALRLRGGLWRRRHVQNARNLSLAMGLLLVRAMGLAERLYDVRRLRGHAARATRPAWGNWTRADALPLAFSTAALAFVVGARLAPALSLYNGYLLLLAAAGLLLTGAQAVSARRIASKEPHAARSPLASFVAQTADGERPSPAPHPSLPHAAEGSSRG